MTQKLTRRQIRSEANFRAGLILESVIAAGWSSDPAVMRKYGEENADAIADQITAIAEALRNRGGRE